MERYTCTGMGHVDLRQYMYTYHAGNKTDNIGKCELELKVQGMVVENIWISWS